MEKIKPSLLTLPEELLRHLVKIVDRQDNRIRARMSRYVLAFDAQGLDDLCEGLYLREPIMGVSALSRTCRKLRVFCCPFLFQLMKSQQFFHPTFRRRIALLHAQHIKKLVLSLLPPKTPSDMEDLVYAASSLPNLVDLEIFQGAVQPPPENPEDYRALDPIFGVLRGVLSRIKILALKDFNCTRSLASFLSLAPNVTQLRLTNFSPVIPDTDQQLVGLAVSLSRALQSIRELTALAVIDSIDLFEFLGDSEQLDDWTSRLKLRSFFQQSNRSDASRALVAFIRSQAPTLRKFAFFLDAHEQFDDSLDVFHQTFPELQYFVMRGRFNGRFPFRLPNGGSTSSNYPKVKMVEIFSCSEANLPDCRVPPPNEIVLHFPSLQVLSYQLVISECFHIAGIPLADLNRYQQFCQEKGIELRGLRWIPSSQHWADRENFGEMDHQVGTEVYVETRGGEVQRLLDYASRLKDRAKLMLDSTAIDQLIKYLEPIRMLEELELD
ncbi:hypothetical protein JCM5350_006470 [Sporobolomyces pararoseus]